MIDQAFTREVKEFAKTQLGVDLVGVAGVDRFAGAPAVVLTDPRQAGSLKDLSHF